MKGKKGWISRANKKKTRQSDGGKLDDLQMHLDNLGLYFKREEVHYNKFFSTPNKLRVPDLSNHFILIELDGSIHGSMDEASESKQTLKRNMDYIRAKFNFIILNEELARAFNLELHNLAAYRVYEEEAKIRAYRKLEYPDVL